MPHDGIWRKLSGSESTKHLLFEWSVLQWMNKKSQNKTNHGFLDCSVLGKSSNGLFIGACHASGVVPTFWGEVFLSECIPAPWPYLKRCQCCFWRVERWIYVLYIYIHIYCMFAYHYISYTPWMVVHVGGNVIILGDSIDLHRIPAKNTLLLVIHVHTLPLSKTNYSLDKLVLNLKITTTSYYANPANTDTNTHTNRTTHTTVLYYVYKQTSSPSIRDDGGVSTNWQNHQDPNQPKTDISSKFLVESWQTL